MNPDPREVDLFGDGRYYNICWDSRLTEAEVRGYFNDEDAELANSWHSCAVGEQAFLIKGRPAGIVALDDLFDYRTRNRLYSLGMTFNDVVTEGRESRSILHVQQARSIHEQIKKLVEEAKKKSEVK